MAKPVDCAHIQHEKDLLLANLNKEKPLHLEELKYPPLFQVILDTESTQDILDSVRLLRQMSDTVRGDDPEGPITIPAQFEKIEAAVNRLTLSANLRICYENYIKILFYNALRCMILYWYYTKLYESQAADIVAKKSQFTKSIDKLEQQIAIYQRLIQRRSCDDIKAKISELTEKLSRHDTERPNEPTVEIPPEIYKLYNSERKTYDKSCRYIFTGRCFAF